MCPCALEQPQPLERIRTYYAFSSCRLLGHDIEPAALRADVPPRLSAPGLPELNHSQAAAVRAVLQSPLSLIQGTSLYTALHHYFHQLDSWMKFNHSQAAALHAALQSPVKFIHSVPDW